MANQISWLLVEDCRWRFFGYDTITPAKTRSGANVAFRRNIVVDAWLPKSHGFAQGLFVNRIRQNFLLEDNLFDHDGWNADVPDAERRIFNRNFYYQVDDAPIVAKGNIFARSSAEGAQFRTGGTVVDNLFVANSTGLDIGHQENGHGETDTTEADVRGNVVLDSDDIDASTPRGSEIIVHTGKGNGIRIIDNIIAHSKSANPVNVHGISLDRQTTGIVFTGNILCDLQNGNKIFLDQGSGNSTEGNVVDGKTCDGHGFPDPKRSVATYDAEMLHGPGTLEHFLSLAREQSKDNWNPLLTASAVNRYIRAGFGLK